MTKSQTPSSPAAPPTLRALIEREIAEASAAISQLEAPCAAAVADYQAALEELVALRAAREHLSRALCGREPVSPLIDRELQRVQAAQKEAAGAEGRAHRDLAQARERLSAAEQAQRQLGLMETAT